ncbi:FmdE family protein [Micromonospora sp. NPDC003776]
MHGHSCTGLDHGARICRRARNRLGPCPEARLRSEHERMTVTDETRQALDRQRTMEISTTGRRSGRSYAASSGWGGVSRRR